MKNLREILGDDLFTQVEGKLKDVSDVQIFVDSKEKPTFIPKTRFDEVNSEKKDYKKQIDQNVLDLDNLKGKVKDNESLVATIDTMKKASADYDVKIKAAKVDSALKVALIQMKAKNPSLIERLFDRNSITFDNDNVVGVSEQLKKIKETDGYLFEADAPVVPIVPPVTPVVPVIPIVPPGGTKSPGYVPPLPGGKAESIGAILARKKTALDGIATTNNFFKEQQ